jgi:hypothetical protein
MSWTAGEAATVNEFLASPIGIKWLAELQSQKPKTDRDSMEKAALTGAFQAGYEYLLYNVIAGTRVAISESETGYSSKAIDPTKD